MQILYHSVAFSILFTSTVLCGIPQHRTCCDFCWYLLSISLAFPSIHSSSAASLTQTHVTHIHSLTHSYLDLSSSLPEVSIHWNLFTWKMQGSLLCCIASFYFVIFWTKIEFGHICDTPFMFIYFYHLFFFSQLILIYNYSSKIISVTLWTRNVKQNVINIILIN